MSWCELGDLPVDQCACRIHAKAEPPRPVSVGATSDQLASIYAAMAKADRELEKGRDALAAREPKPAREAIENNRTKESA